MFRTVPLSIIRSLFNVHSAMVYVIQVYGQLSSRSICSCSKAVYKPVWHIPLLSVHWKNSWWWTDVLSETCRVSWQNKFMKSVHLVGFITRKFVTMHGHMNGKIFSINLAIFTWCTLWTLCVLWAAGFNLFCLNKDGKFSWNLTLLFLEHMKTFQIYCVVWHGFVSVCVSTAVTVEAAASIFRLVVCTVP
jgi:hypothetical protein